MIRQVLYGILTLSLLVCGLTAADDPIQPEPPVRLKKKVRPPTDLASDQRPDAPPKKAEPRKKADPGRKPETGKDDADPEAQDLEQKIHELTNRISKNMGIVEDRLDKKDAGQETQIVQRDISKDLEELIEQTRRQQQQQQQSSSSSSSKSQQARMNRMQRSQQSAKGSQQAQNGQMQDQRGNNARGGNRGGEGMSKIADIYKDIWGHLPETLRQEMDQYSREQFMAKYNELLKQYYATIAEKGRRKGD